MQAHEIFDGIGFMFRNWSLLGEAAGVIVMEKLVNVGETFTWLMGVASTLGSYLASNWVNLIRDAAMGAWTILSNFGNNVKALFQAIKEWSTGKGFNFAPVALLDGFKATMDKLPEIAKPAFTSMQKDLDMIFGRMAGNEVKRMQDKVNAANGVKAPEAPAAKARPGELPRDAEIGGKKKDKAQTFDPVSFSKHLQEGLMGKNKVAERGVKATESIVQIASRIEAQMNKPKPKPPAVPGFAI